MNIRGKIVGLPAQDVVYVSVETRARCLVVKKVRLRKLRCVPIALGGLMGVFLLLSISVGTEFDVQRLHDCSKVACALDKPGFVRRITRIRSWDDVWLNPSDTSLRGMRRGVSR